MPLSARYYTDPACAASWAAEPRLRTLIVEFGNDLSFTYVMGGLARDFEAGEEGPSSGIVGARAHEKLLLSWLDRAAGSRMPLDPRLWAEAPIKSSYPACIAVKAAAEQGPEAAERYLRFLREGIMCFRRKLDSPEPLAEVAREAGLDAARFRIDAGSHAALEAFGADLEETRSPPPPPSGDDEALKPAPGGERLVLPSLCLRADGGREAWVFGDPPYEDWRAAALAAGARPADAPRPDPLAALRRFGRMATVEIEAVCDLSRTQAEAALWRLATDGRARPRAVLTGTLWESA